MNAVDAAAVAAFPEIEMLLVIRDGGWKFLPPEPGRDQLDGFRTWPHGWRDGIRIRSATDALGIRMTPDQEIVWERTGTLTDVIGELLVLPAPDEPNAPRLVLGLGPD
ncbi:hypothetical protein Lesp02_15690 [Lentzea sp. NBRC 105346]|uniref:hypothetical protein n=1 Tax=Lentzea sp. NBRC 105346 TaxID=3032205 RepID=UPI0024A3CEB1|nr:hypothetical protein [Lentzea sp. NBRC 105346]GLZ29379.1 hypothetical protein Lesp02_15690 [Lentzea sp. NBRC 105346]